MHTRACAFDDFFFMYPSFKSIWYLLIGNQVDLAADRPTCETWGKKEGGKKQVSKSDVRRTPGELSRFFVITRRVADNEIARSFNGDVRIVTSVKQ